MAGTALPSRGFAVDAEAVVERIGRIAARLLQLTQFAGQCGGSRSMYAAVATACDEAMGEILEERNMIAKAIGWPSLAARTDARRTDSQGKEPRRSGVDRMSAGQPRQANRR
jgi:hypothetical protein